MLLLGWTLNPSLRWDAHSVAGQEQTPNKCCSYIAVSLVGRALNALFRAAGTPHTHTHLPFPHRTALCPATAHTPHHPPTTLPPLPSHHFAFACTPCPHTHTHHTHTHTHTTLHCGSDGWMDGWLVGWTWLDGWFGLVRWLRFIPGAGSSAAA